MSQVQIPPVAVFELTAQNFQSQILDDPSPILIDFWAQWCGPCRVMKPLFHEAVVALQSEVRAASVNVDEEPRLSEAFGIRGIPTLILIREGKVIDSWSGVLPVGAIVERVRASLGSNEVQA